jgi:hypothetical protein
MQKCADLAVLKLKSAMAAFTNHEKPWRIHEQKKFRSLTDEQEQVGTFTNEQLCSDRVHEPKNVSWSHSGTRGCSKIQDITCK